MRPPAATTRSTTARTMLGEARCRLGALEDPALVRHDRGRDRCHLPTRTIGAAPSTSRPDRPRAPRVAQGGQVPLVPGAVAPRCSAERARPARLELDSLAEALGDDHDIAVLVALLDDRPDDLRHAEPGRSRPRARARSRQHELRTAAIRAGATIYAEPSKASHDGSPGTGHSPATSARRRLATRAATSSDESERSLVERERRFLIEAAPDGLVPSQRGRAPPGLSRRRRGTVGSSSRRRASRLHPHGEGRQRGSSEPNSNGRSTRREFDAAWPHTEGRRIEKARHRIPFAEHVIELDVFAGGLEGLVIAEVEFDSVASERRASTPPAWFGREVTDDGRYTNAALALFGRPDDDSAPLTRHAPQSTFVVSSRWGGPPESRRKRRRRGQGG